MPAPCGCTRLMYLAIAILLCPISIVHADGRLHLLLACDTADPDLGEGFELVKSRLDDLFHKNVAEEELQVTFLAGPNLTAEKLKDAIDKAAIDADDSLFLYLACHGNLDPKTGAWFTLSTDDSVITRAELARRLQDRKPQFAGLITDACSDYARYPLPQVGASDGSAAPRGEKIVTQPLFRSLFFRQRGFLDLASSSEGEFAVYHNNYRELLKYKEQGQEPPPALLTKIRGNRKGGVFTESLADLLARDRQKKLNWDDLIPEVSRQTLKAFRKEVPDGRIMVNGFPRNQPAQTVAFSQLPTPLDPSGANSQSQPGDKPAKEMSGPNRLGARCRVRDGMLVVVQVDEGSVADDYRLAAGDSIRAINGVMGSGLDSLDEFDQVVKKASLFIRVVVVKSDGTEQSFTAMLK